MDHLYEETLLPEPQINAKTSETRGKNKIKTTKKNSKSRKKNSKLDNEDDEAMEDEEEASGSKKLDHNAKERIRRMKLNASYLALCALLPDSRRSKKKWSAPAIVDKVLKYIPELENEIEALRLNKENHVQSQAKTSTTSTSTKYQTPSISLTKINRDEAVFQVCMGGDDSKFSKLLQTIEEEEGEGICIKSASALYISETRTCHHLHIQRNNTASEAENNHFEELGDRLISWMS